MRILLKSMKRPCPKRAAILLLAVALIAGLAGCTDATPLERGLTIIDSIGGSVTVPGEGGFVYEHGEVVILLAVPEEEFRFVRWSGDVDTVSDVNAASTTITMNDNYLISASFEVIHNLTISSTTGGSVTGPGEGPFSYENGTVVQLVAVPAECYRFVTWTGDAVTDPSTPTTTISTTTYVAKKVTAIFAMKRYDVTAGSTAGGSVTMPGEGMSTHDCGAVVDIKATAHAGHRFVGWTGDIGTIADAASAVTTVRMQDNYSITANFVAEVKPMVAAGAAHTVGLQAGGRVVAAGRNTYGQGDVADWNEIAQIAAGSDHTVGLKLDGTVVAVGRNDYGQCDVGGWTNIVQIAAGGFYTLGIRPDGTVVTTGDNTHGQRNVGAWTGITQVAAGVSHTVGLKSDGTVLAVGHNVWDQCDVGDWTDIIQVAAGAYHTIGLRSTHTAVSVGWDVSLQTKVGSWIDIVQVDGGYEHSVGLRSDGNLVGCVGWKSPGQCAVADWKDIVYIAAGAIHTVGLKSDGTVLAVGHHNEGQCDVGDWMLN